MTQIHHTMSSFGRSVPLAGCLAGCTDSPTDLREIDDSPLSHLGATPEEVEAAKASMVAKIDDARSTASVVYGVVATVSMGASAYHGYKRNDSIGWALWWGLMGSMFPIITPVIAVAQGFGEPEKK